MLRSSLAAAFLLFSFSLKAQELFPRTEPASNSPKGALGVRMSNEFYREVTVLRSMQNCKFMWALTNKLMLTQAFTFANHHGARLPDDFIKNDGNIGQHTHGNKKGNTYPYGFENASLTLKYRFLSLDGQNSHFRMAAFAEAAAGTSAHDEAEVSLMGDNSGGGGGIIATVLHKKFAASVTGGAILPYRYVQKDMNEIIIEYGNAYYYSLSFGYLLFPFRYKDYNQTNLNLYMEFIGKSYDKINVNLNSTDVLIDKVPSLEQGNYVDVFPGMQLILNSSTRVDISVGLPLISRSYVHTYPFYYLGIQRYFYF